MQDYNQLLDNVYELEGLLQLAMSREEVPESLPRLIRNKALSIAALADEADSPLPSTLPDRDTAEYRMPENSDLNEGKKGAEDGEDAEDGAEDSVESGPEDTGSAPEIPSVSASGSRHAPAFSINDRFLFIRELFGSDASAFDAAMAILPTLDSFEEAEAYFYDDLSFDPERRSVVRFMAVISEYFRKR